MFRKGLPAAVPFTLDVNFIVHTSSYLPFGRQPTRGWSAQLKLVLRTSVRPIGSRRSTAARRQVQL